MKDKNLLKLVQRASQKDQAAFETLCELKAREIIFLCTRELGNPQDGEDAAQEVFMRMQKHIGNLQAPEAFNVWLNRIIMTTCSNVRRSNMRHKDTMPIEYFDDVLMDDTLNGLPQEYAEDADKRRRIVQLIDELPEKYRTCVLLHYYQHMSYDDIAKVTDSTRNAVDNNLRMARKILKLELENELEQETAAGASTLVPVGAMLSAILTRSAEATVTSGAMAACLKAGGVYTAFAATAAATTGIVAGVTAKLALQVATAVAAVAVVGGGTWYVVDQVVNQPDSAPPAIVQQADLADGTGGQGGTAAAGGDADAAVPVGRQVISGQVVLNNEQVKDPLAYNGLAGLTLELVQAENPDKVIKTAVTKSAEEAGSFAFRSLAPGQYKIRLLLPDHEEVLAAIEAGQPDADAAEPEAAGTAGLLLEEDEDGETAVWLCIDGESVFTVKENTDIEELYLEMALPAMVSGRLVSQGDLDPALLDGIEMELWDPQMRLLAVTETASGGAYRFEGAMISQYGNYTIRLIEHEDMEIVLSDTELELSMEPGMGYGGLPESAHK